MTEGIDFKPLGTIEVSFDDKTYKLGRPKMRQFRHFSGRLDAVHREVSAGIQEILDQVDAAEKQYGDNENSAEARAELRRLEEEHRKLVRQPFYEYTIAILAEMFDQLGDPLPPDPEEWPAWLAADSSIPGQIITHWRTHPKVSGQEPNS